MSTPDAGPATRERVLAVAVALFGVLALVAAVRSGAAGYAAVGAAWLASAGVLWRLTGTWLLLGLGLFAAGFAVLAATA